jgi:predicted TIM-barrel fold metal-dependent hydrolase
VIDTHVHHIDLARFRYPWLDDPEFGEIRADYLPADYRAEVGDAPLEGWVHVQAEIDRSVDPAAETAWIEELAVQARAAGLPGPLGLVAYADLAAPDVGDVLARHCRHPLTRGIRQEAWFDPSSTRADIPRENALADDAWRDGYAALASFGLSFDLLVWPHQLPRATELAAGSPDVPVVLEHLGLPNPGADPDLRTWRAGIRALAELPHAHAKLSAFNVLGVPHGGARMWEVIEALLDVFGPARCMFGSNFPVERLGGDYPALYELILSAIDHLSEAERTEILSGAARRFYRLEAAG